MKTSRRLLLGTFLVLLATPVVIIAYSRINGGSVDERRPPERPQAAELAALRDFDAIVVRGDFALEVSAADNYSVEYSPLPQGRGFFRANVDNGVLTLEGFGNRNEFIAATVRVAMPELTRVEAGSLASLTISNFASENLDLRATVVGAVVLADNRIGTLQMQTQVGSIEFRGNTIERSEVRTLGTLITTE